MAGLLESAYKCPIYGLSFFNLNDGLKVNGYAPFLTFMEQL